MEFKGEFGDPELIHTIDDKLKENPDIIFGKNESIPYNELIDKFPIDKFNPIKALICWDDVMQFTSLGTMEVLNSIYNLDIKIVPEHFFKRPNMYCNGMLYVYEAYKKHLTKKQIDDTKRRYYWKILQISMKSAVFQSICNISTHFKEVYFYFPFTFPELEMLIKGIKEEMFKTNIGIKMSFYVETVTSIEETIADVKPSVIIHGDVNMVYRTILLNDLKKVSIIGPVDHNNIDDVTYKILYKLKGNPLPNYCSIDLYEEQVIIPNLD